MQRITLYLLLLCFGVSTTTAQISSNMLLLGSWNDTSLPVFGGIRYNDIWGYEKDGREYAIVGGAEDVLFIEITDPANPGLVASMDNGGDQSIWRDIKTFGNYAYTVADQSSSDEGILVFDLSNINGASNRVTFVRRLTSEATRAHNLFIDEATGFMYIIGLSGGRTFEIYDLNTTPDNPVHVATVDNIPAGYVHDAYINNHRAYLSSASRGHRIYDMTPLLDPSDGMPSDPVELGVLDDYSQQGYSHSGWATPDNQYFVFADETHGRPMGIVDISDPADMTITDRYISNLLGVSGPIAHNPYIRDNYCIVSHYHDGIVVFDISDPDNVVQVAHYDTYTGHSGYSGYDGTWGVYPFLPSGNIIGSDVLNGLFVLQLSSALQVKWVNINAQTETDAIKVNWATSREEDNAGFVLQRQTPSGQWEDLERITPDPKQKYEDYDYHPYAGWNTYRVQQTDFDGTVDYSPLANAFYRPQEEWQVFPNPVVSGGEIEVRGLTAGTQLILLDAHGRNIWQAGNTPAGQLRIELPQNLPAGTYWLEDLISGQRMQIAIF